MEESSVLAGRYRITGQIGQGGMGVVYRAEDTHLNREVAIKTLLPDRAAFSDERVKRFLREVHLLAKVKSPFIVTLYDALESDSRLWIIMELLDGRSLRKVIEQERDLPLRQKFVLFRQILEALQDAHDAGIIHRDLKPENVFVLKREFVKVLDFGLAKFREELQGAEALTQSSALVGSPLYMAPEQWMGQASVRSDVFAAGCIFFELLTGIRPFSGKDIREVIFSVTQGQPPPLTSFDRGLPEPLEGLFAKALAKDPANRFATATEFWSALHPIAEGLAETADPASDFEFGSEIGRGGMGIVYEGTQKSLRRKVALKVLPLHLGSAPEVLARFRREYATLGQLRHPNIVSIINTGVHQGSSFFAMEYVGGKELETYIAEWREARAPRGKKPRSFSMSSFPKDHFKTIARWMAQVARALDYIHRKGVLHRDVKPSNIKINEDGQAIVLDFGLAYQEGAVTVTQTRDVVGTARYMSPEQLLGRKETEVDQRSDLYSLGATMYEVLVLQPAYPGDSFGDILKAMMQGDPPAPRKVLKNLPAELQAITLKCLEKEKKHRYSSGALLAEDLERYLAGQPVEAGRSQVGRFVRRTWRRGGPSTIRVTILLLAFFGLIGIGLLILFAKIIPEFSDQYETLRLESSILNLLKGNAARDAQSWGEAFDMYKRATTYDFTKKESLPGDSGFLALYEKAPPPLFSLSLGKEPAFVLPFPEGRKLLVNTGDLFVLDIERGQVLRHYGTCGTFAQPAISPDGRFFALATEEKNHCTAAIWNGEESQPLHRLENLSGGHLVALAFSPDSRFLTLSIRPRGVGVWEVESGSLFLQPPEESRNAEWAGFVPGALPRLAWLAEGTLHVWDYHARKALSSQSLGDVSGDQAAFSPDGSLVAVATSAFTIKVTDFTSGNVLREFGQHSACINQLVFGRDQNIILSSSLADPVREWNWKERSLRRSYYSYGAEATISSPRIGNDVLVHCVKRGGQPKVDFWETCQAGECVVIAPTVSLGSCAISPDSHLLAFESADVWNHSRIVIADAATGRDLLHIPAAPGRMNDLEFVQEGKSLCLAGTRGLSVVDLATGRMTALAVDANVPFDEIQGVAGHEDLLWCLEGSRRLSVRSTREPLVRATVQLPAAEPWVLAADRSLSHAAVALQSSSKVSLWAFENDQMTLLKTLKPMPSDIFMGIDLLPNASEKRIVAWEKEHEAMAIRIWETGETPRGFGTDNLWGSVSPSGRYLAGGKMNGGIEFWMVDGGGSWQTFPPWPEAGMHHFSGAWAPSEAFFLVATDQGPLVMYPFARARVYRERAEPLDWALRQVREKPEDAEALKVLGEWCAFRRSWDRAIRYLTAARANGAKVSALALARCYWLTGAQEEAADEFRKAKGAGEAPGWYLDLCMKAVAGELPDIQPEKPL